MSRLQSIENALRNINETVFQELCDSYLAIRNENYSALARIGSMTGKQKTISGTPDSLLLLPSGKYIFVECSTNITKGVTKLEEDVRKCLNTAKTGIPGDEIMEIILCINFNLDTKDIESLRALLSKTRIRLTIISLDSLSIELHLNHRDLAHHYLNLPLDTGQIVSIDQFIEEYNRASNHIATPLDNVFISRDVEMARLEGALLSSDFIILTGPPGIGKTKLVIETLKRFLKNNLTYNCYCISYKSYALLDDLYQYINPSKDYILFVDDANRIDAFNQITGFYKAARTGKLKIVITVRDYAYNEIGRLCQEFAPQRIDLVGLTDEIITDIIKSESFEILNPRYQKEIIKIADGNPRLAVMAALLAKAHQNLAVLHDVSDLFEKYFSIFVKDKEEFADSFNLKCLGLIGFFYTLPYKDRQVIIPILHHFNMEYAPFLDTIDRLDKMELVEIQYEYVKIPEQNLAIYFFYKAFIKDTLLSFATLLQNYFESNKSRFRECVISANNTFGPQNVMTKLKPDLVAYWNTLTADKDRAYSLLQVFWFYLNFETFEFLINEVDRLSDPENPEYLVEYSNNDFAYDKDEKLSLIGEYFRITDTLADALALGFRYIEKEPQHLPELIHKIREQLLFDVSDARNGFLRQHILFDFLIQKIESNIPLYASVFYELAQSFLKYKFQHTEGGRNNSFSWYFYPIPNIEPIQLFRTKVWTAINEKFELNQVKAFAFLESYATVNPDVQKEIMAFDMPFLIDTINKHLKPKSFIHCRYVHNQIRWCKRMKIQHEEFSRLEQEFTNSLYEIFLKIDWNRLRDKRMFEFGNHREYEKLKEEEIRQSFIFHTIVDVRQFYSDFAYLKKEAKNEWNYNTSLEMIIDENFKRDFKLGFEFYKVIVEEKNEINYVPRLTFKNQLASDQAINDIWGLIDSHEFQAKTEWKLSFFDFLDENKVSEKYIERLLITIESIKEMSTIYFDGLVKYLKVDSTLFQKILKIIIKKNEQNAGIRVWMDFFSTHFEYLGEDLGIIKKAYLQQFNLQDYFDYELVTFSKIMELDPHFLLEFVNNFYSDRELGYGDEHRSFKVIWNIPGIEKVLFQIFEIFAAKNDYYAILPIYLNTFFRNLDEEQKIKADNFLIDYVRLSFSDTKKINQVVDIVRHERKELFERVLLTYISLNKDVEDFKKIWWRGNGGTYFGDVIMGDIEAVDWRNILSIVEKSDVGIDLIPIKRYILNEESSALKQGDWERKRRFIERY